MVRQLTNKEMAELVECEGLGYAVGHYLCYTQIEDYDLANEWRLAQIHLENIMTRLKPYFETEEYTHD
jgi:hypothetical protein